LLHAHDAGAIPLEQLKSEHERITREIEAADRLLAAVSVHHGVIEAAIEQALVRLGDCRVTYCEAGGTGRCQLNQAVLERLEVGRPQGMEFEPLPPI